MRTTMSWFGALCLLACCSCLTEAEDYFTSISTKKLAQNKNCTPRDQQQQVDLNALTGYWYVVEMVGHREEDRVDGDNYREITLCPLMFLSLVENSTDLRLRWEEPMGIIEYRFRVADPTDPGFWMSLGQQNGSLAYNKNYHYRQFAGTVQVMRAVSDDMVLTFCSPHTHHYSMVMSRNRTMGDHKLHSLNRMLKDRGLPQVNTRVACRGSAGSLVAVSALVACLAIASRWPFL